MANTGYASSGLGGSTLNSRVTTSTDGGRTWQQPVVVASGIGDFSNSATVVLNDKPWLVADNNPRSPHYGRLYLTWTRFAGVKGVLLVSPIYLAYSDDAGKKWSEGREISGSNATYCSFAGSSLCEYDQFSTPVVLPNGDVVVHFQAASPTAFESPGDQDSQTMVVRSTDGGATWSPPLHIANLEDGRGTDYPLNFFFYATQTGHQFTTWSVQGMTADPVTGDLYAFWTDNRDGLHDVATPVTQTNVFMTKSTDGGLSWVGPTRITSGPGDRWMPWGGAYGGVVRVMYMDGSYDMDRTHYGVTLASSSDGGASWSFERVDPPPSSNPNYVLFFPASVTDCYYCTGFIGDYQGMAMDSLGRAHIVWTDLSRPAYSGYDFRAEDVSYARR
jgi:BNR/Asp-box repeat